MKRKGLVLVHTGEGKGKTTAAIGLAVRAWGDGFTRNASSEEMAVHREKARTALQEALTEMTSGQWDMIILDEINYALNFGLLEEQEVLELLSQKPTDLHLVLTGRNALPAIIDCADLVTEMRLIKHPFQKGIRAQKGIEF